LRKRKITKILGLAIAFVFIIAQFTGFVFADPPEEKVTGTVRYTTGSSSYLTATYSSLSPVPNEFGIGNSAYNAWCVDNTRTINTGNNYSVIVYNPYDGTWIEDASISEHSKWASIPWDKITWLVNNRSGYTKGEVQDAIWKLTDDISITGDALTLYNSIPSTVAPGPSFPKQILVNWVGNDRQLLVTEYTPPSFDVTYNANGGTGTAPVDSDSPYYPGEEVTVLGQGGISWSHHTFEGWNTTSGGSGTDYAEDDTFDMGYADVELFAQWEPIDYTVTYAPGEHGTFDSDVTGGLHFGDDTPEAPATPGDEGWEFDGWDPDPTETVEGNATYTAQWVQIFTVTYDPGEHGTFDPDVTNGLHLGDSTPEAPATPGEPGWSFDSWSPTPTTTVEGTATYVAQWTQDEYTVTYEPGTQGTFETQETTGLHYNDDTPEAPETTGNPGFTFTGWSPLVAELVTGDATYVAQWSEDVYTVKYQPGEHGTFDEQVTGDLTYGDPTPDAPATPGDPGWEFTGWDPEPTETVTSDATYVAQWTQIDYTVTFQPGDHGTFAEQVTPGLHYDDPTPDPPVTTGETGWAFAGWEPSVAETVSGNATYVAQWTLIPVAAIDVEKEASPSEVFVGQDITFTITVTNTGNQVLYNVDVVDERLDFTDTITILDPGQTETYTITYTTNSEDVPGFTNTAVGTTFFDQREELVRDEDSATVTVNELPPPPPPVDYRPGISVSITPDATLVEAGTPVTFTMVVTNTGLLVLDDVEVVNTDLDFSTTIPKLFVAGSETFTVTKELTEVGNFTYTVTATGTAPSVSAVSDTDVTSVGVFEEDIPEEPPVIPPEDPVPGDTVENPETGALPAGALTVSGLITFGAGIFALLKRKKEDDEE